MKKTELILIVDRSGSMGVNHYNVEMENGINNLIADQMEDDGDEVHLTLVQFDDEYDVVHDRIPIKDTPKYKLLPSNSTALLDAIGKTINTIKGRFDALNPDLVMLCIVTDGGENASQEYQSKQVQEMIAECEKDDWKVTYLGANQDAFATARSFGLGAAQTTNFDMSNTAKAYSCVSEKMKNMRGSTVAGAAGASIGTFTYTDDERTELEKPENSDSA